MQAFGWKRVTALGLIAAMTASGCIGSPGKPVAKKKKPEPKPVQTVSADVPVEPEPVESRLKEMLQYPVPKFSEAWAVNSVVGKVSDAMGTSKTLVVWLVDASSSANLMRQQVVTQLQQVYPELDPQAAVKPPKPEEAQLLSAVVGFGEKVTFITEEPTANPGDLPGFVGMVEEDKSGAENTFGAVEQALEKYLPYQNQGRQVLFVIVTNEAGDDHAKLDSLLTTFRRQAAPVYVIGAPAPFGAGAGLPAYTELDISAPGSNRQVKVNNGSESRYPERIQLAFAGYMGDADLDDAGFGPFGLSALAYQSGGDYFRVRQNAGFGIQADTPTSSEFDPALMERYRPEYVTEAQYQALLQENAARMALYRAAQLPGTDTLVNPQTTFPKGTDEAAFARDLGEAQQAAAAISERIESLYTTLQAGERDREKLASPRLQAGFDLAIGRAAAAKARTEGYNVMLANMKQGRNFQNPNSTTWVLEPAETTEGNSQLERLAKQARTYLERVVKEHPGTPWAVAAQRELETPAGWRWVEQ